ncbi:transposase [Malacoplasma iowae]
MLFLYSKGIPTRDIQETIYKMFYCNLEKDTISKITDKIIPEIVMWQ